MIRIWIIVSSNQQETFSYQDNQQDLRDFAKQALLNLKWFTLLGLINRIIGCLGNDYTYIP